MPDPAFNLGPTPGSEPTPTQKANVLAALGIAFAIHDVSEGAEILAPTGTFYDGQTYLIRVINGDSAAAYISPTGFRLPAGAANPPLFSTGVGQYDYLKLVWNATGSVWDVVSLVPGYPVTPT